LNYSVTSRALLKPDEVLTLSDDYLIAFLSGMPPVLARRIKWYRDPAFKRAGTICAETVMWWGLLVAAAALAVWAASRRLM
jgi:type IV secretory pathway TraG/TraD family ATPase VirD4